MLLLLPLYYTDDKRKKKKLKRTKKILKTAVARVVVGWKKMVADGGQKNCHFLILN